MEFARSNVSLIGEERYIVVRYEDLTTDPENYMKQIASFINIPFNKKLLKPTIFGVSWQGNNFNGINKTSPNPINVSRWQDRIDNVDAKIIEFYFEDMMDYFEYKPFFSKKDSQLEASNHYKWFNYSNQYSYK